MIGDQRHVLVPETQAVSEYKCESAGQRSARMSTMGICVFLVSTCQGMPATVRRNTMRVEIDTSFMPNTNV